MRILRFAIPCLVIVGIAAFLVWQGFITGELEAKNLIRGLLLIAAAAVSMLRKPKHRVVSKKIDYQKTYGQFIQNAFADDPKQEKEFYSAVHQYAQSKSSAALRKLERLRRECQRTNDLRAVTVFTALCLDDMQLYDKAIVQYDAALRIRDSSTLHSNMGLCYLRLGRYSEAEACYQRAIHTDPQNAFAYNNLSVLYLRQEKHEEALEAAQQAVAIDGNMQQALNTAAICCALMGREEEYRRYYRRAVTAGSDGQKLKAVIAQLIPGL